jgi:hypothetical protein
MTQEKRKIGRPRLIKTLRYDLLLEEKTAEWGKTQDGGLSAFVRRLLREAYEKAHKKS